MNAAPPRLPTLFLPHGGGPCFFMDWEPRDTWAGMAAHLRSVRASLPARPKALLLISGHWEAERPTVTTAERPALLFDYSGFPPHTYQLRYPAPGSPETARRVRELLAQAGIASDEDPRRGFDHGVFIPLLVAFPEADLPVVQLSLREDLDARAHLALGRALAPLRDEGVLIVGSGMSFHNLRAFWTDDPRVTDAAARFDTWLGEAVMAPAEERDARLSRWTEAPHAAFCHPRPEHLIPLLVAAGAAGDAPGVRDYGESVMGKAQSGFRFG
jgi:aromatic ring-opening dioxygenase catalytic subunit (LigB family)